MANINISPNMNLPIPVVGVDPGPDWASNINSSLTLIDQHNHASGSGVPINPNGLNINADLPMNGNNLTLLRSTRYQAQGSPLAATMPDLDCLYVSGVDLYYNDGNGNQVRMTSGGNVVGNSGSITGLTSPASASYNGVSGTFIWESDANTAANMDFASAVFRDPTVNSNGITVSPPNALASSYTLTLPTLPSVQSFMTLDSTGNIAAPWTVDNSTLAISGSNVIVKNLGIGTAQIADAAVTQPKMYIRTTGSTVAAGGFGVTTGCGLFSTTNTGATQITNLSITITLTGRPVIITMAPDLVSNIPLNNFSAISAPGAQGGFIYLYKDGNPYQQVQYSNTAPIAFGTLTFVDTDASTGSHTYSFQAATTTSSIQVAYFIMTAYEVN